MPEANIYYADPPTFRDPVNFDPTKFKLIDWTQVDPSTVFVQAAGKVPVEALEIVYRAYNVVDGSERPMALKVRSLSVGDVVEIGGKFYGCMGAGWEEIPHVNHVPTYDDTRFCPSCGNLTDHGLCAPCKAGQWPVGPSED